MKTLLIIFLLAGISFAQSNDPLSTSLVDSTREVIKEKFPTYKDKPIINYTLRITETWQQEFIDLWTSYQKECYADSSLSWTYCDYDSVATEKYYKNNPDRWYGVIYKERHAYSHKQPQFTGFMNYLKTRLGEE